MGAWGGRHLRVEPISIAGSSHKYKYTNTKVAWSLLLGHTKVKVALEHLRVLLKPKNKQRYKIQKYKKQALQWEPDQGTSLLED